MTIDDLTPLVAARIPGRGRGRGIGRGVGGIVIDSLGRRWDPRLHPRGRNGWFIEVGGFVKLFSARDAGGKPGRRVIGSGRVKRVHGENDIEIEVTAGPNKGKTIRVGRREISTITDDEVRLDRPSGGPARREDRLPDADGKFLHVGDRVRTPEGDEATIRSISGTGDVVVENDARGRRRIRAARVERIGGDDNDRYEPRAYLPANAEPAPEAAPGRPSERGNRETRDQFNQPVPDGFVLDNDEGVYRRGDYTVQPFEDRNGRRKYAVLRNGRNLAEVDNWEKRDGDGDVLLNDVARVIDADEQQRAGAARLDRKQAQPLRSSLQDKLRRQGFSEETQEAVRSGTPEEAQRAIANDPAYADLRDRYGLAQQADMPQGADRETVNDFEAIRSGAEIGVRGPAVTRARPPAQRRPTPEPLRSGDLRSQIETDFRDRINEQDNIFDLDGLENEIQDSGDLDAGERRRLLDDVNVRRDAITEEDRDNALPSSTQRPPADPADVVRDYQMEGVGWNTELRAGNDDDPKFAAMDKLLAESTFDAPNGMVFRGLDEYRPGALDSLIKQLKPGNTVTDLGYMSTSKDVEVAKDIAGPEGIVLEIRTMGRNTGLDFDKFGDPNMDQQEVLLPRGTSMQIDSVDTDDLGRTVVRARLVPTPRSLTPAAVPAESEARQITPASAPRLDEQEADLPAAFLDVDERRVQQLIRDLPFNPPRNNDPLEKARFDVKNGLDAGTRGIGNEEMRNGYHRAIRAAREVDALDRDQNMESKVLEALGRPDFPLRPLPDAGGIRVPDASGPRAVDDVEASDAMLDRVRDLRNALPARRAAGPADRTGRDLRNARLALNDYIAGGPGRFARPGDDLDAPLDRARYLLRRIIRNGGVEYQPQLDQLDAIIDGRPAPTPPESPSIRRARLAPSPSGPPEAPVDTAAPAPVGPFVRDGYGRETRVGDRVEVGNRRRSARVIRVDADTRQVQVEYTGGGRGVRRAENVFNRARPAARMQPEAPPGGNRDTQLEGLKNARNAFPDLPPRARMNFDDAMERMRLLDEEPDATPGRRASAYASIAENLDVAAAGQGVSEIDASVLRGLAVNARRERYRSVPPPGRPPYTSMPADRGLNDGQRQELSSVNDQLGKLYALEAAIRDMSGVRDGAEQAREASRKLARGERGTDTTDNLKAAAASLRKSADVPGLGSENRRTIADAAQAFDSTAGRIELERAARAAANAAPVPAPRRMRGPGRVIPGRNPIEGDAGPRPPKSFGEWGMRAPGIIDAYENRYALDEIFEAFGTAGRPGPPGAAERAKRMVRQVFEAEFPIRRKLPDGSIEQTSYRTEITSSYGSDRELSISGRIMAPNPRRGAPGEPDEISVGGFSRRFGLDENGQRYAYNSVMEIQSAYQGGGFAVQWNRRNEDWYIANGFSYVGVNANIDKGGYAWARTGFDWKPGTSSSDVRSLANRIRNVANRSGDQRSIDQINDILERIRLYSPRDQEFPTPFELANVGWYPGRKEPHPGQVGLLGTNWNGRKSLKPDNRVYRQLVDVGFEPDPDRDANAPLTPEPAASRQPTIDSIPEPLRTATFRDLRAGNVPGYTVTQTPGRNMNATYKIVEDATGRKFILKRESGYGVSEKNVQAEVDGAGLLRAAGWPGAAYIHRLPQGDSTWQDAYIITWVGEESGMLDNQKSFQQRGVADGSWLQAAFGGSTIGAEGRARLADEGEILRLYVFDVAINNTDRHVQNLIVHRDSGGRDHFLPFDHGLALRGLNDNVTNYRPRALGLDVGDRTRSLGPDATSAEILRWAQEFKAAANSMEWENPEFKAGVLRRLDQIINDPDAMARVAERLREQN